MPSSPPSAPDADGLRHPPPRRRKTTAVVFFVLAAAGLLGTWFFNLSYHGGDYVGDWFANPASSSIAIDMIVIVLVAAVVYVAESRTLGWSPFVPVLFTALSVLVAVSFAFPLFLGLRELRLRRLERSTEHPS